RTLNGGERPRTFCADDISLTLVLPDRLGGGARVGDRGEIDVCAGAEVEEIRREGALARAPRHTTCVTTSSSLEFSSLSRVNAIASSLRSSCARTAARYAAIVA